MRTIDVKDMGKSDEKGNIINRTIAGKSTETKPTEYFEDIPLREGDVYIEANTGKCYMYEESDNTWNALGGA